MTTKKNTKASTKRNTKRETPNTNYRAVLSIFGEVQTVYEGDKAVYLTIKVWNDSEYYSSINITLDYDLAENYVINEGDEISVKALCSSFYDKKTKRVVPLFNAFEVVTKEPF